MAKKTMGEMLDLGINLPDCMRMVFEFIESPSTGCGLVRALGVKRATAIGEQSHNLAKALQDLLQVMTEAIASELEGLDAEEQEELLVDIDGAFKASIAKEGVSNEQGN